MQAAEDAEDGPPELMFIHSGHTGEVSDLAWNAEDEWVMASVDSTNALQVGFAEYDEHVLQTPLWIPHSAWVFAFLQCSLCSREVCFELELELQDLFRHAKQGKLG